MLIFLAARKSNGRTLQQVRFEALGRIVLRAVLRSDRRKGRPVLLLLRGVAIETVLAPRERLGALCIEGASVPGQEQAEQGGLKIVECAI